MGLYDDLAKEAAQLGIPLSKLVLGKAGNILSGLFNIFGKLAGQANKAIDAMQLISFVQFIQEEAYQTAMFGLWPLLDAGEYEEAWAQLEFMERLIDEFDKFNATWGKGNLLGAKSYNLYVQAARRYIEASRRAVKKKLLYKGYKFALEEAKRAYVFIDSNPDRAKIYVDDEYIHHLTPEDWTIDAGKHKIVITKSKYDPLFIEFEAEPGKRYEIDADFEKGKIEIKKLPDLILPETRIRELEEGAAPEGWQPPPITEISATYVPPPPIPFMPKAAEELIKEEEKPPERPEELTNEIEERVEVPSNVLFEIERLSKASVKNLGEFIRVKDIKELRPNIWRWTIVYKDKAGNIFTTGRVGFIK